MIVFIIGLAAIALCVVVFLSVGIPALSYLITRLDKQNKSFLAFTKCCWARSAALVVHIFFDCINSLMFFDR